MTSVKHKCFGKVKFRNEPVHNVRLEKLYEKKSKSRKSDELPNLDKEILEELRRTRKENLERDLNYLKKLQQTKGNIAAIFKLKEANVGKKSLSNEATTLIDPELKPKSMMLKGSKVLV